MIRILNAEPLNYSGEARHILQSIGELVELQPTRAELLALLAGYDVVMVRLGFQVDCQVIDAGHRLRVIVTATTGLDHVDVEYAARRGIAVLSLRGEIEFLRTITATAKHTWALLLALVRQIPHAFSSVCCGEWNRDAHWGHELYGKCLGIVGTGRIGEQVAHFGLAFGMEVVAYDPYCQAIPAHVKRLGTLDELMAVADVVSLHVPLNYETAGLIGDREMRNLKQGALLINTSRGAVLDETSLLQALSSGRLAGAALDVLSNENPLPTSSSHPLIEYAQTHSNLIITPHLGGATYESMKRTEVFMAEKLKAFLQGRKK